MVDAVTPLVRPNSADVAGYVDAVTADRALGWAWAPKQPGVRVEIELRFGEEVVAAGRADQLRPDLAASGIGDGQHAFEVPIPAAFRDRSSELHVVARASDGKPVMLSAPRTTDGVNDQIARLARGIDMLVNSQRVMHKMMQSTLAATDGATLAKLADAQAAMSGQFAALERFVVRLDEQLLKLSPSGAPAARRVTSATIWALTVASVALVVGLAGLVHSLAG